MAADREGRQRQRRLSVPRRLLEQGIRAMGKVIGLFTSAAPGERMCAHVSVRALAGCGLEGDRYACGHGSYSRLEPPVARHVSLIRSEDIEAANKELMRRGLLPFSADESRRNIVIEGVDVYALLGQEFRIGDVCLRGSDPTRPCRIPSAVAGKAEFREAYHGRGGIRAEVLSDGVISIGDVLAAAARA